MMVFIREITNHNGDKILLKPLTFKEYLKTVNSLIIERKKEVERLCKLYEHYEHNDNFFIENGKEIFLNWFEDDSTYNEEDKKMYLSWIREGVKNQLNFQYYPVPCENYKNNNRWINTKNLEKYRIKQ